MGRLWSEIEAQRLAATATPQEWQLRDADGNAQERWVSIGTSPLDPAGGRILLISDITEARRLREQLERHKRLSAMGEMAAGLAHQLRTPLATALLYTGNLARPALPGRGPPALCGEGADPSARPGAHDPGHAHLRARRARRRTI